MSALLEGDSGCNRAMGAMKMCRKVQPSERRRDRLGQTVSKTEADSWQTSSTEWLITLHLCLWQREPSLCHSSCPVHCSQTSICFTALQCAHAVHNLGLTLFPLAVRLFGFCPRSTIKNMKKSCVIPGEWKKLSAQVKSCHLEMRSFCLWAPAARLQCSLWTAWPGWFEWNVIKFWAYYLKRLILITLASLNFSFDAKMKLKDSPLTPQLNCDAIWHWYACRALTEVATRLCGKNMEICRERNTEESLCNIFGIYHSVTKAILLHSHVN